MKSFDIGEIRIRPLQCSGSIEMFEMTAAKERLGLGAHFHRHMEESFYAISGQIIRNSVHSWKTAMPNTKMLILFSPAQNQYQYFIELEKIRNHGSSLGGSHSSPFK
jgi:hypothetical protein